MNVGQLIDALAKFPRDHWVRLENKDMTTSDSGVCVSGGTYWNGSVDEQEPCVLIHVSKIRDRECEN